MHGIAQRTVGNFSMAAVLRAGWKISERNAVLGLIIHLHLSKKVFAHFLGQGCLTSGIAGFRPQASSSLLFQCKFHSSSFIQ